MKEYAKCLYYENACFDNPIVTVRDGQNRKHLTLEEVVDCLNELFKENDNCKNDYRELFSNYVALEEENEQLKQKLENLNLNEKNDIIKKLMEKFS